MKLKFVLFELSRVESFTIPSVHTILMSAIYLILGTIYFSWVHFFVFSSSFFLSFILLRGQTLQLNLKSNLVRPDWLTDWLNSKSDCRRFTMYIRTYHRFRMYIRSETDFELSRFGSIQRTAVDPKRLNSKSVSLRTYVLNLWYIFSGTRRTFTAVKF